METQELEALIRAFATPEGRRDYRIWWRLHKVIDTEVAVQAFARLVTAEPNLAYAVAESATNKNEVYMVRSLSLEFAARAVLLFGMRGDWEHGEYFLRVVRECCDDSNERIRGIAQGRWEELKMVVEAYPGGSDAYSRVASTHSRTSDYTDPRAAVEDAKKMIEVEKLIARFLTAKGRVPEEVWKPLSVLAAGVDPMFHKAALNIFDNALEVFPEGGQFSMAAVLAERCESKVEGIRVVALWITATIATYLAHENWDAAKIFLKLILPLMKDPEESIRIQAERVWLTIANLPGGAEVCARLEAEAEKTPASRGTGCMVAILGVLMILVITFVALIMTHM